MELLLQNDNSSRVINLHHCFEVDVHVTNLDKFYQMFLIGTRHTGDKFKQYIMHAFMQI